MALATALILTFLELLEGFILGLNSIYPKKARENINEGKGLFSPSKRSGHCLHIPL
jgi:hypothetical protein